MNFKFNTFSKKNITSFIELSKIYYPDNQYLCSYNYIYKKYFERPNGKSYIHEIKINNKVEGRLCYQQDQIIYKNNIIESLKPQDLLVSEKARLPFTNTLKLLNEPKDLLKNYFILNTSNKNSDRLYSQILKFPKYFDFNTYFFFLNPISIFKIKKINYFFRQIFFLLLKTILSILFFIKPKIKLEQVLDNNKLTKVFNLKYKRIAKFNRNNKIFLHRLSIYQNNDVTKLILKKNNKQVGYLILIKAEYKKFDISIILDFYVSEQLKIKDRLYVLWKLLTILCKQKTDILFVSGNDKCTIFTNLIKFPFLKVPDKFLEHKSPFYGRNFNCKINNLNKFHLTLFDMDWF